MNAWSTGCWPRRTTASAGAGTGSTSSATPTRPAATPTSRSRRPTATATTSSTLQPRQALRPVPPRAARRRPAAGVRGRAAPRAGHRHRLPGHQPPLRLGRRGVPPDARGHDRQPGQGGPRAEHQLRPLPRPQVRPDPAGRLLRPLRHLPEHPLPLPRDRDLPTSRRTSSRWSPPSGWSASCARTWTEMEELDREIFRTYSPVETLDTGKEKDRLKARVKELQDEARRAGEGSSRPSTRPMPPPRGRRPTPGFSIKGDPTKLGPEVPRGFLQVLGGGRLPPDEAGSGRLQLADWLTDPANPLTARVMVNRIWQHHFGRGLVRTPNDFGTRGRAADAPGAARLPGAPVRRGRLVDQGAAPADRALARPTRWPASRTPSPPGATRRTSCSGRSTAAGSTRRRSATRCWPSAAGSTARRAGRTRSRPR